MKVTTGLLFVLLLGSNSIFAQSTTYEESEGVGRNWREEKDSLHDQQKKTILLIPFSQNMFNVLIGADINAQTQMSFDETYEKFRAGLDFALYEDLFDHYTVHSFYKMDKINKKYDLPYIHHSIGYKKLEMPLEEEEEKKMDLKKVFAKKKDHQMSEAGLYQGQVVSTQSNVETYMQTVLKDAGLLDSLKRHYGADYFLFVNQLDVVPIYAETTSMEQEHYDRKIKAHYTIFNDQKEIVSTGAKETKFDSRITDVYVMLNTQVGAVADMIVKRFDKQLRDSGALVEIDQTINHK